MIRRSRTALAVLLVLALLGSAGCLPGRRQDDARPITARGDLAEDEKATIELFRSASPSVVFITTLARRRDYFSLNVFEIPAGSGSGFVWDREGHIVTNYHVVLGASRAIVKLANDTEWEAEAVGLAPDHDLAVLRITAPAQELTPVPVGTSSDLLVGQKVFAIGNPFGLDHTLTTGIISALAREIQAVTGRTISGVIQTDAAINPGNSGGPLLDSAGRLIGMNTAIASPTGASVGVGFAVPADTINRIVTQLIARGSVPRAGLGVQVAADLVARRNGVDEGVLVLEVAEGSAAAAAGVRGTQRDSRGRVALGDVIVGVDTKPVRTSDDLGDALDEFAPGDTVAVTLSRQGEKRVVPVVLQELEAP